MLWVWKVRNHRGKDILLFPAQEKEDRAWIFSHPQGAPCRSKGKGKTPQGWVCPHDSLEKNLCMAPLKEKKEDKAKLGSISQQQQQQDQDCSALNGHGIPWDGKSKAAESSPSHVPASYKKCCAFISLPQRFLFHWRTPKLLIETKKPQPESEGKSLGPPRFCLSCDILTQIIPSLRSSPGFHFILGRGAGVRLGESQKCPAPGWC